MTALAWARTCAVVRERVLAGLAREPGAGEWNVTVAALGVRDELAVPGEPGGPGGVPIHLDGRHALVGPLWTSDGIPTPCPRCLARRWQLVRPNQLRDAWELGRDTHAVGELPHVTAMHTDALVALVRAHVEADGTGADTGSPFPYVSALNLDTLEVHRVRLVADSECPQCSHRRPDTPEALDLQASPKRAPDVFRLRDLADYDLPYDAFVNDVCGALGRGMLREHDLPTTSAVSGCFTARSEEVELYEIFWGGHVDTFADSVTIGLMEGLERYAGMRPRAKTIDVIGPLAKLRDRALDPRDCGMYTDEFYDSYPGAVAFSEDRDIPWVWGWSLRDSRPILVPEVVTYYHSTVPSERFVQECSNGCASGGSLVEATLFGLLEVIERDAFLVSWYGMAPLPEIDPMTSVRPRTREMVDRLAMYGYQARFFDTRVSFPIPVVTGVAVREDGGLGAVCFGAGASLDPETALAGSLVEIATDALRLRRRAGWEEAELRTMVTDFNRVRALHDHPMLYGLPEMLPYTRFLLGEPGQPRSPSRPVSSMDDPGGPLGSSDLRDDLQRCVSWLAAAGHDVIVVDHTTPEQSLLGLHAASVIVPGLIPIDFGWRRQRALTMPRTRTAPHEAGFFDHVLRADELNPAPHPFP